jgi:hypothetical protein
MARFNPTWKLLIAIVIAIAVGKIVDSVAWGIGTFFIAMFFFILVWSWVFGSPFKSKVVLTVELTNLLNKLEQIGQCKNELPLSSRDWCSSLGLCVQYRHMGKLERLEAGSEKLRCEIDASKELSPGNFKWQVEKYRSGKWERLVEPSLAIARWLQFYGGLPEKDALIFQKAIERYKQDGVLELPPQGG